MDFSVCISSKLTMTFPLCYDASRLSRRSYHRTVRVWSRDQSAGQRHLSARLPRWGPTLALAKASRSGSSDKLIIISSLHSSDFRFRPMSTNRLRLLVLLQLFFFVFVFFFSEVGGIQQPGVLPAVEWGWFQICRNTHLNMDIQQSNTLSSTNNGSLFTCKGDVNRHK